PGIGKSRLIAELERYVGAAPHQLLRFLCSPHHLDTPLRPVIQFIERAANFQRGDSPAAKWEKLTNVLPPDISLDDKALLADLLSIPCEVRNVLNDLTPQHRKAMTFATMFRQLDRLVRQNPTLAVVEDIHWADPSTLELLDRLVEILQRLPMLLVITARPEVHPAWAARPYVTVQLLSGLDRPTAASLIKQVVGERELPREVIDRIIVHSDNVPLFIEELTKTVLKRLQDRHGKHASPLEPLSADVVPTSLYSSLMERLDRSSAGKE